MEIKIACETKLYLPLENLTPFQGSLKDHGNKEKLKKQILDQGFAAPIFVWKNDGKYYILDGHGRCSALQDLKNTGYKIPDLPCVEIHAKTKREAKKKLLSYVSQFGKVTGAGLYEFINEAELTLEELDDFEIPEINLEDFKEEFFPEDKPVNDGSEDEIPEVAQNELGVKLGDIFELGNHRLMCGDSTDLATVEKLMNGEKAELCFTSPPYADQREYRGGKELSTEHLATFIKVSSGFCNYFAVNLGISRKDGQVNPYWDDYIKAAQNSGLKLLSWNVWHRGRQGSIGLLTAMFIIAHEWIFVFGAKAKGLNKTVENISAGQFRRVADRQKDGTIKYKEAKVAITDFGSMGTVLDLPAHLARNEDVDHPAMFPIALPEEYINAMTIRGQIVYEPFCGSGSTLIACEKTGRKCYGSELDPHYCSVIIKRWEEYTGKKHKKLT